MRIEHPQADVDKGWFIGPWNSQLTVSVGYATRGIDDPHYHAQMTELYLVARGTSEMLVGQELFRLKEGDVVMVQPGETHTFTDSSPDYFHFVIHTPALIGEAAVADSIRPDPSAR